MQYALLFHTPGDVVGSWPAPEREAWFAEMTAWGQELRDAGIFRAGLRLASAESASCVRRDGAATLVTDGPFADTKEYLGGFAIIDVADLDAALAWSRRCPIVRIGTVEVRPEHT